MLRASLLALLVAVGLSGCKKSAPAKPVKTEVVEEVVEAPAPPAAAPVPAGGALPLTIAPGAGPDAVLSRNGAPIILPIDGRGAIEEVRDGGLTLTIAGERVDIAFRLSPEIQPPFVVGEVIGVEYRALPPANQRALDLVIRRGKAELAKNIQFLRLRMAMPAMRYLADGQIQLEQVGSPHPAKEGDGQTPFGLDVAVTVAGRRAVVKPGDVVPITLREGAADLTIVSSLLRGGKSTIENGIPPYTLVATVVPAAREPDAVNPAGPSGKPLANAAPIVPMPAPVVLPPPAPIAPAVPVRPVQNVPAAAPANPASAPAAVANAVPTGKRPVRKPGVRRRFFKRKKNP